MSRQLPTECSRVVLSEHDIAEKVLELGERISADHPGERIRLVTVLKGSLFFMADLARAISSDVTLDFMAVSPYSPGRGGVVRVTKDLDDDISGQTVLLVEDVVDTGLTVNYVRSLLLAHSPATLEVCALLDKPGRRIADVPVAYTGFTMGDEFLVGYGLDLNGRLRNLPYVAALRPDVVFQ